MKNAVEKALEECYTTYKKKECSGWFAKQKKAQETYDLWMGKVEDMQDKIYMSRANIRDRGGDIWLPGQAGFQQNGWMMHIWGIKTLRKLCKRQDRYWDIAKEAMDEVEKYERLMADDYEESGQRDEDEYDLIQCATQNNG